MGEWKSILKRMFQKYGIDQEWDLFDVSDRSCTFEVHDPDTGRTLHITLTCDVAVWSTNR